MAIKNGQFQDYAKNQDRERKLRAERAKRSKYSHGEVFDEDNNTLNKSQNPKILEKSQEKTSETIVKKSKPANKKHLKPSKKKQHITEAVKQQQAAIVLDDFQIVQRIVSLKGLQYKLFSGLLLKAQASNMYVIEKITNKELIEILNSSYENTKLTVTRLVNKGLLKRHKGKTSKFGYYSLGFDEKVFKIAVKIKSNQHDNEMVEMI